MGCDNLFGPQSGLIVETLTWTLPSCVLGVSLYLSRGLGKGLVFGSVSFHSATAGAATMVTF